jgi:hypothetical protein
MLGSFGSTATEPLLQDGALPLSGQTEHKEVYHSLHMTTAPGCDLFVYTTIHIINCSCSKQTLNLPR